MTIVCQEEEEQQQQEQRQQTNSLDRDHYVLAVKNKLNGRTLGHTYFMIFDICISRNQSLKNILVYIGHTCINSKEIIQSQLHDFILALASSTFFVNKYQNIYLYLSM